MNETLNITQQKNDSSLALSADQAYAGFGIRFLAYSVDMFLIIFVQMVVFVVMSKSFFYVSDVLEWLLLHLAVFMILGYAIRLVYLSVCTHVFGGSIGKLVAGLRVVDLHGQYLTWGYSFFRYMVGYPVSNLLGGLGFLWITRNPHKQGWHDGLTGSYVLKPKSNAIGFLLSIVTLILLSAGISYAGYSVYHNIAPNMGLQQQFIDLLRMLLNATGDM